MRRSCPNTCSYWFLTNWLYMKPNHMFYQLNQSKLDQNQSKVLVLPVGPVFKRSKTKKSFYQSDQSLRKVLQLHSRCQHSLIDDLLTDYLWSQTICFTSQTSLNSIIINQKYWFYQSDQSLNVQKQKKKCFTSLTSLLKK